MGFLLDGADGAGLFGLTSTGRRSSRARSSTSPAIDGHRGEARMMDGYLSLRAARIAAPHRAPPGSRSLTGLPVSITAIVDWRRA
ncbi:MAG: hypothetical protein R3F59_28525 [Myxococcota bacterium]